MKHDYQKVINDRYLSDDEAWVRDYGDIIEHALKLAAKVTGEPSDGMYDIGITISERDGYRINEWACPSEIFTKMIAQAEREIE